MNRDDKKLDALYRLKGLASTTSKTISRIIPGSRKVAEQNTEVVTGITCFFIACFAGTFFVHSAPEAAMEGLRFGALIAAALTGGHLVFRVLPRNRALRRNDAKATLQEKVEQLKRENVADRKRAAALPPDGYERLLLSEAVAQRQYEIACLRNMENQVLADDLGVEFIPPTLPPSLGRELREESPPILPDRNRQYRSLENIPEEDTSPPAFGRRNATAADTNPADT